MPSSSEVGTYFTNYDAKTDWHRTPAWLDGREVIAVSHAPGAALSYVIELRWINGQVSEIHDFRYGPCIMRERPSPPRHPRLEMTCD